MSTFPTGSCRSRSHLDMRLRLVFVAIGASVVMLATASAHGSVEARGRSCAEPNGRVSASVARAGVLYVGGSFTKVTDRSGVSHPRARLAAIDVQTCRVLPWRADTNGDVYALRAVGSKIYAGGDFTRVGGKVRHRLAAVSASNRGAVLRFSPNVDRPVRALSSNGTRLYAGGSFTKVNRFSRGRLAAFAIGSGRLTRWKPVASGPVMALAVSARGTRVYVGGSFSSLRGRSAYRYLGAVDATTGRMRPSFQPHAKFPILSLAADSRGLYAGGGGHGGHLAIWNRNGSLQRHIYQTDGGVQAVAVRGDSLFAGGHFTNYCVGNTGSGSPFRCDKNLSRRKLLEVSLSSGKVTRWAPSLDSPRGVFTETVHRPSGNLWIGGDFTTINGQPRRHLSMFAHAN